MISNGPTCWIEFQWMTRDLCVIFNGSVSGGGRTVKRNSKLPGGVKGHPNSRHLWRRNGAAVDIVFDTQSGFVRARAAAKKLGLKVIDYPRDRRLHVAVHDSSGWVPR